MEMRDEKIVKEDMASRNTMWWTPEDVEPNLALHFKKQLEYVVTQFDWNGKKVLDAGTGGGDLHDPLVRMEQRFMR